MTVLIAKDLLAAVNGAMLIFVIGTLAGHFLNRNKLVSWASAFNSLCILWLSMRQIFWSYAIYSADNWSAVRFYLLYWLPHPIQFAMYLIIPIFYVQIIGLSETGRQRFGMLATLWQKHRKCMRSTYIGVVTSMLVYLVGVVFTAATVENKEYRCVSRHWRRHKDDNADACYHDISAKPMRYLSASCFLFLSVVIAVFGAQVREDR